MVMNLVILLTSGAFKFVSLLHITQESPLQTTLFDSIEIVWLRNIGTLEQPKALEVLTIRLSSDLSITRQLRTGVCKQWNGLLEWWNTGMKFIMNFYI